MSCIVRLTSTGESVDVSTSHGANAFLEQPTGTGGFNFFSTDLKTVNAIRKRERKKGKLNNTDRQTLRQIYGKVCNVATSADPELFFEKVPMTELEAWLNHVVEILRQITNDRKWINTGSLLQHDYFLMTTLVGLSQHPTAVALMWGEVKVLETISNMMSLLEKPPTAEYVNNVIVIVEYTYSCRYQFEPKWKPEKTFKKLESTGIMEHYLRCSVMEGSGFGTMVSPTFKDLLKCTAYLRKSFKEGTPCGDTVRAIVKGTDAHPPCSHHMLPYMHSLILLSTAPAGGSDTMFRTNNSCHYCDKRSSEEALMRCAKCLQAVYCSRECQRADWKAHKKICAGPVSSSQEKNSFASEHLVNDFVHNHYVNIMFRMVEECDKAGGLNVDEVVLELDVSPDPSGIIPLLRDPPQYQIVPIAKYLDGTQFNEPNSVFARRSFKDEIQLEQHNKKFIAALKYQQSLGKPTELLSIVSHANTLSFQAFQRTAEGGEQQVFSREAVEAFRSLKMGNDDSLLWEIFTSESEREFMRYQLAIHFNHQGTQKIPIPIDPDKNIDPEAAMATIQSAFDDGDYATLANILGEGAADQIKRAVQDAEVAFEAEDRYS